MERDKTVKSANFYYQTYASQRGNNYARSALRFMQRASDHGDREKDGRIPPLLFFIWIIPSKVLL